MSSTLSGLSSYLGQIKLDMNFVEIEGIKYKLIDLNELTNEKFINEIQPSLNIDPQKLKESGVAEYERLAKFEINKKLVSKINQSKLTEVVSTATKDCVDKFIFTMGIILQDFDYTQNTYNNLYNAIEKQIFLYTINEVYEKSKNLIEIEIDNPNKQKENIDKILYYVKDNAYYQTIYRKSAVVANNLFFYYLTNKFVIKK